MSSPVTRLNEVLSDRYRVERELGEGGMATVYLAEDLKHERKVAIKVLKPELAAVIGAARFVAEIKTTAGLQHPHILPLFDSGEADGFLYYVMPYIEGESLRERLDRERQLGVDEAVGLARKVADALDYAHRQGVIHRDIKPANILLQDDRPVVADFGIALAVSAAGGGRMTETGLSLGTPHYMSPEQASADRDVSARSDIYSLGCALYEMIAGDPPHTGPSAQSVLVRILTDTPEPLTELRHTTPPHVAAAVARSLEKLPADRFETAADFAEALQDPSFRYTPAASDMAAGIGAHSGVRPRGRSWLSDPRSKMAVAAVVILVAAAAWMAAGEDRGPVDDAASPSYHFVLRSPLESAWPVVGSDGAVWVAERVEDESPRTRRFVVRLPGSTDFVEVGRARMPPLPVFAVSPDGASVAFLENQEAEATHVYSLSRATGERTRLVTLPGYQGISITDWSQGGWIYGVAVRPDAEDYLNFRVPSEGGQVDTLPLPSVPGKISVFVRVLPGDEALLYNESTTDGAESRVMAFHLASGDTVVVADPGGIGTWSPTGHVVYGRAGGFLDAVPFDPEELEVIGPARQVMAGLMTDNDIARFHFAGPAALAYVAGPATGSGMDEDEWETGWLAPDGTVDPLPLPPTDHDDGRISPDGSQIAYVRNERVWLFDRVTGENRPLGDRKGARDEHNPVWSPDGRRLLFASSREDTDGMSDLYVQDVHGGDSARRLGGTSGRDMPHQWREDGTVLFNAFLRQRFGVGLQGDLYTLDVDQPGSEASLLRGDWNEQAPYVSPGGDWLAYVSGQSGRDELWIRRYPQLRDPLQVSAGFTTPVFDAVWRADGSAVRYMVEDTLYTVELDLSEDGPEVVSRTATLVLDQGGRIVDQEPDGERFLRFREIEDDESAGADVPELVLVTNWLTTLRERMGEGGG